MVFDLQGPHPFYFPRAWEFFIKLFILPYIVKMGINIVFFDVAESIPRLSFSSGIMVFDQSSIGAELEAIID